MTVKPLDIEAAHARLEEIGSLWADADAAYNALDDVTKTVLSECMAEHEGESQAKAEAAARRSAPFKAHLEALAGARRRMNLARVKYDSARAYIELYRTEMATQRVAMGMR